MATSGWSRWRILVCASLFSLAHSCVAEQIRVKHAEGAIHGFMVLRTEEGKTIAAGDLDQTVQGARVTKSVKFRFQDGSKYEETTTFTQRGAFRVLSDHLLESGPAFKQPMEVWIDCATGQIRVRQTKDGKDDITNHHVDIPADLANGIFATLVENFPDDAQRTFPMLVATPKPRLVKLVVTPEGEDAFSVEGTKYTAKEYVAKVEIGGVAGAVAPVVGKQPPDIHLWIFRGETPVLLKTVGPLSPDTPVWQIEMASPTWPRTGK